MPTKIINIIALALAVLSAVPIGFSIRYLVKLFDSFGGESSPDERRAQILRIRNKLFVCYAAAVGLIAAAAMLKIFLT